MPDYIYVMAASYGAFRQWANHHGYSRRTGHIFLSEPEQIIGRRMSMTRFITLPGAGLHPNHQALISKIASVTSKAGS